MDANFEDQKEKLISIKHEISLLFQQVNYLLRNEKTLELLDLDVLMNRTHTLYDLLCSINLGEEPSDEDLPFDAEAISGLFGGLMQKEEPEQEPEQEPENDAETVGEEIETLTEANEEMGTQVEVQEEPVIEFQTEPVEEPAVEMELMPTEEITEEIIPESEIQNVENEQIEDKSEADEQPLGDELGFLFRFENIEDEPEQQEQPNTVEQKGRVVHVMEAIPEEEIPERDRVHGEDLVKDNPFEMPKMENEEISMEVEEIGRQDSDSVQDIFNQDDTEFELSTVETLGEKMMGEDHSLAAKLQQGSVRDLKSVIGINDKFLFVNELFGGSMERYNKAIDNLNDLKTLNGAMIYLNELKIELQWNSSNEAYQKLSDLVKRKFE